jgi:hypothetical protein
VWSALEYSIATGFDIGRPYSRFISKRDGAVQWIVFAGAMCFLFRPSSSDDYAVAHFFVGPIAIFAAPLVFRHCRRNVAEVWEDTGKWVVLLMGIASCGMHCAMQRGYFEPITVQIAGFVLALWGMMVSGIFYAPASRDFEAVIRDDVQALSAAFDDGMQDVRYTSEHSLLTFALHYDSAKCARLLLSKGSYQPSDRHPKLDGCSPARFVCFQSLDTFKAFVDTLGMDSILASCDCTFNPIHSLVRYGEPDKVQYLLSTPGAESAVLDFLDDDPAAAIPCLNGYDRHDMKYVMQGVRHKASLWEARKTWLVAVATIFRK